MTLQSLTTLEGIAGSGYESGNSSDVDLKSVLTEIQGYKISMAAAGASGACCAVTSMTASDTIKAVLKMPASYGAITDVTSAYTAVAGGMTGNLKALSDAAALIVFWADKA